MYVDDLIITDTNPTLIQKFITQLNYVFAVRDLGDLHYCLGIQITRSTNSLTLHQQGYIRDILERIKMTEATPLSTLADAHSKLQMVGDPFSDPKLYR